jgi:hypothetical protein
MIMIEITITIIMIDTTIMIEEEDTTTTEITSSKEVINRLAKKIKIKKYYNLNNL